MAAIVLGGATGAAAAVEPALTVTPSTGLEDGQSVQAAATGFGANEVVYFSQCGEVDAQVVCDPSTITSATTSADGDASATMTVRSTFIGVDADGQPVGLVDCTVTPEACVVTVANEAMTSVAWVPVSFGTTPI